MLVDLIIALFSLLMIIWFVKKHIHYKGSHAQLLKDLFLKLGEEEETDD